MPQWIIWNLFNFLFSEALEAHIKDVVTDPSSSICIVVIPPDHENGWISDILGFQTWLILIHTMAKIIILASLIFSPREQETWPPGWQSVLHCLNRRWEFNNGVFTYFNKSNNLVYICKRFSFLLFSSGNC